jgi:hypothetical protein
VISPPSSGRCEFFLLFIILGCLQPAVLPSWYRIMITMISENLQNLLERLQELCRFVRQANTCGTDNEKPGSMRTNDKISVTTCPNWPQKVPSCIVPSISVRRRIRVILRWMSSSIWELDYTM